MENDAVLIHLYTGQIVAGTDMRRMSCSVLKIHSSNGSNKSLTRR